MSIETKRGSYNGDFSESPRSIDDVDNTDDDVDNVIAERPRNLSGEMPRPAASGEKPREKGISYGHDEVDNTDDIIAERPRNLSGEMPRPTAGGGKPREKEISYGYDENEEFNFDDSENDKEEPVDQTEDDDDDDWYHEDSLDDDTKNNKFADEDRSFDDVEEPECDEELAEAIESAKASKSAVQYFEIGIAYYNGKYQGKAIEKNYMEAMRWFLEAALSGYAAAMRYIGIMHYYGRGVEVDISEALRWFLKAAEEGDAESYYYAGHIHMGIVPSQNLKPKFNQDKMAELNSIGIHYIDNSYPLYNYSNAFIMLSIAASGDVEQIQSPEACFDLGEMYRTGKFGIAQNKRLALFWLKKARDMGLNVNKQIRLCARIPDLGECYDVDYAQSNESDWMGKICDRIIRSNRNGIYGYVNINSSFQQRIMQLCEGVREDEASCRHALEEIAIIIKDPTALRYSSQWLTGSDRIHALYLSCVAGNRDSALDLAKIFLSGDGVIKDLGLASYFVRKAGSSSAVRAIIDEIRQEKEALLNGFDTPCYYAFRTVGSACDDIKVLLTDVQQKESFMDQKTVDKILHDIKDIESLREYALVYEDPLASWLLGEKYLKGEGVARNYINAYKWFRLAADKDQYYGVNACINLSAMFLSNEAFREDKEQSNYWENKAVDKLNNRKDIKFPPYSMYKNKDVKSGFSYGDPKSDIDKRIHAIVDGVKGRSEWERCRSLYDLSCEQIPIHQALFQEKVNDDKKNNETALYYYAKFLLNTDPEGNKEEARMFVDVVVDIAESVLKKHPDALESSPEAPNVLELYALNYPESEKSLDYLRAAADVGNIRSQYELGLRNKDAAYIKISAKQGCSAALQWLHDHGKNRDKIDSYTILSAICGSISAMYDLCSHSGYVRQHKGIFNLFNGKALAAGLNCDYKEHINAYIPNFVNENRLGAGGLYERLCKGIDSSNSDRDDARLAYNKDLFKLQILGTVKNDSYSQFYFAEAVADGKYAGLGIDDAYDYYCMSLKSADPDLENSIKLAIANCEISGELNRKDISYQRTFDYFYEVAENGESFGYYEIGKMYEDGIGVEKDDIESQKYYKLAYDNGFLPARQKFCKDYKSPEEYGYCFEQFLKDQDNCQSAVRALVEGAKANSGYAQYYLGRIYLIRGEYENGQRLMREALENNVRLARRYVED